MYVMLIKTSDMSCVLTDSLDDFATGSFEFSYLRFYIMYRRKKAIETGKGSMV